MRPVIAIIGRPNVGKSTLFNRLSEHGKALVHDTPGVTRDYKEAEGSLGPLTFTVVDTAGLEEDKAEMAQAMQAQTEAAVKKADVLLFVVDGKAGITAMDEHFSRWARKSNTPVVMVVNKCEGKIAPAVQEDALRFGFGEPVAISAEHGLGMAELYTAVAEHLPEEEQEEMDAEEESEGPVCCAIIGRPNVGKSTLLNQILGEERAITGPEAGVTRDAVYSSTQIDGQEIQLVDTAGIRRRVQSGDTLEKLSVEATEYALRFAHVAVVVVDATQGMEKQDIQLAGHAWEEGRAAVIALNKWDAVQDPDAVEEEIAYRLEKSFSQGKGIPVCRISALKNKGIKELLAEVLAVYARWNQRISTGQLNNWLERVVDEHPPPLVGNRRLKLRYMTQTKTRPPQFVVFASRPKAVPASYHRYLLNHLQRQWTFAGVPLRLVFKGNKNPYV